jgi:hypothetical protein
VVGAEVERLLQHGSPMVTHGSTTASGGRFPALDAGVWGHWGGLLRIINHQGQLWHGRAVLFLQCTA